MKVSGIDGSFHLRKIKGRAYWYHYWYDPADKKMKSKRKDPPQNNFPNKGYFQQNLLFTNDLPMRSDKIDKSPYEAIYQNVYQLIARILYRDSIF